MPALPSTTAGELFAVGRLPVPFNIMRGTKYLFLTVLLLLLLTKTTEPNPS
jgi:hypothetical protein